MTNNSPEPTPVTKARFVSSVAARLSSSVSRSGEEVKYDDASWHYGADNFPKDLAEVSGATHTGMFVAWALLSGLSGSIHIEDFPDDIPKLVNRSVTPAVFFLDACDGKFTDEDLNEEGNRFAGDYFEFEKGQYLADYGSILGKRVVIFTTSQILGRTSIVSSRFSTGDMPTGRQAMANKSIEFAPSGRPTRESLRRSCGLSAQVSP